MRKIFPSELDISIKPLKRINQMGLILLCLLFHFSSHVFSTLDFLVGSQVTIPVPSVYQPDFVGRAFLLDVRNPAPSFRAALSVEAVDGSYSCSLIVLLGDVKVWASDHFVTFFPTGSCMLELTEEGGLQLKDRTAEIGWNSGTFGQGVQGLHLKQNTGNLVLTNSKNQTIWQSFSFPTNIMLWGQRLNLSSCLTSFLMNNSSQAFYSLEVQQYKIKTYLNWRNKKYSYWEFKPTNNRSIAFIRLVSRGLKIFDSRPKKVGQILAKGSNAVRFMALGSKGNIDLYNYSAHRGTFQSSYRALPFCDLPLPCGPYGICSSNSTCTYLQLSKSQYNNIRGLHQGIYDGFCGDYGYEVEMIKLQRTTTVLRTLTPNVNVSNEECLTLCLQDCSCAAALYLNNNNGSRNGSVCYQYGLFGGAKEVDEETDCSYWVKVPKETSVHETSSSLMTKVLVVGGVIDAVALFVILGGLLYYFFKVRKRTVNSGTTNN